MKSITYIDTYGSLFNIAVEKLQAWIQVFVIPLKHLTHVLKLKALASAIRCCGMATYCWLLRIAVFLPVHHTDVKVLQLSSVTPLGAQFLCNLPEVDTLVFGYLVLW